MAEKTPIGDAALADDRKSPAPDIPGPLQNGLDR
jgi:hypothetical protein